MASVFEAFKSISSAAVIAIFLALVVPITRSSIINLIAGLVNNHFEGKLESLRSEIRQTEEYVKSNLQNNEGRINAIINRTTSLVSNRHSQLEAKKIEAIEMLWKHKAEFDHGKGLVYMTGAIKLDEAAKEIENNDQLKQFFQLLNKASPIDKWTAEPLPELESKKPFVESEVWSIYDTYKSVIMDTILRMKLLSEGINPEGKLKDKQLVNQLKATLPEYENVIDQYGLEVRAYIIDIIDKKLLEATHEALYGTTADISTRDLAQKLKEAIKADEISDLQEEIISNIPPHLQNTVPQELQSANLADRKS